MMIGVVLVQVGILDLQTMTVEIRPSILLPLGIALYTAYKLPTTESMSDVFK